MKSIVALVVVTCLTGGAAHAAPAECLAKPDMTDADTARHTNNLNSAALFTIELIRRCDGDLECQIAAVRVSLMDVAYDCWNAAKGNH
jgi:hypothetical protein